MSIPRGDDHQPDVGPPPMILSMIFWRSGASRSSSSVGKSGRSSISPASVRYVRFQGCKGCPSAAGIGPAHPTWNTVLAVSILTLRKSLTCPPTNALSSTVARLVMSDESQLAVSRSRPRSQRTTLSGALAHGDRELLGEILPAHRRRPLVINHILVAHAQPLGNRDVGG